MMRVQVSRGHFAEMPKAVVACDRHTEFANPYSVMGTVDHKQVRWWVENTTGGIWPCDNRLAAHQLAVELHRAWIMRPEQAALRDRVRALPRDAMLGCWCALADPCHCDTLVELASTPLEGQPL